MENFGRRAADNGQEAPVVTLARIDENIKFLKVGAEVVRIQLANHERQDEIKFNDINKTIWRASGLIAGAFGVVVFISGLIFKH